MTFLFHWKHKNLLLFIIGLLMAWFFSQNKWFHDFFVGLGNYGYLSAILAGALFVSTFTMVTGILILTTLASTLSPIEIILLAGLGAVLADILIFKFVRDDVDQEIEPIYKELTGGHFRKLFHTKYFGWTLPVIGTLIIISPLPDELGVSLLGMSKISTEKFILISWMSHTLGMFLLVSASIIF
jgi:uncharacterized membrane protein YdjX (TVP38/TMEM64 family)